MAIGGISQSQAIEPLLKCSKLDKDYNWALRQYAYRRAAKATFYIGDIPKVQDILNEILLLDKTALNLRDDPVSIRNFMNGSIRRQSGLEDIGKRCFF